MDMFHAQAYLGEPVQDLLFREGAPTLVLNSLLQVATYYIKIIKCCGI